jgi:hypothetical protein
MKGLKAIILSFFLLGMVVRSESESQSSNSSEETK